MSIFPQQKEHYSFNSKTSNSEPLVAIKTFDMTRLAGFVKTILFCHSVVQKYSSRFMQKWIKTELYSIFSIFLIAYKNMFCSFLKSYQLEGTQSQSAWQFCSNFHSKYCQQLPFQQNVSILIQNVFKASPCPKTVLQHSNKFASRPRSEHRGAQSLPTKQYIMTANH